MEREEYKPIEKKGLLLFLKNLKKTGDVKQSIQLNREEESKLGELFTSGNLYKHKICSILLIKLEFEKMDKLKDNVDFFLNHNLRIKEKEYSVEHLLPQDHSKWKDFTEWHSSSRKADINKLGNLTLLSKNDNSISKNCLWNEKKGIYQKKSIHDDKIIKLQKLDEETF